MLINRKTNSYDKTYESIFASLH